jgi:hypothetical protein
MLLPLKRVPPFTDLLALRPPNLSDYTYFDAMAVAPFSPDEAGFTLGNASWLADAALLAYAEESFAWAHFQLGGLKPGKFFRGLTARGYVGLADRFILVSFRGMEVTDPLHFALDALVSAADFLPAHWGSGSVHHGFLETLNQIWPGAGGIGSYLKANLIGAAGPRKVWFTGHSLGAALATLAAAQYRAGPRALYTFASPRVGDAAFAAAFGLPRAPRLVHNQDLVPRLPPPDMGFKHVGDPYFIDAAGRVSPGAANLVSPGDTLHGPEPDLIGAARLNLFDHAPIYYATKVFNAFALTQS